jgi:hypothetical protein
MSTIASEGVGELGSGALIAATRSFDPDPQREMD